MRPAWKPLLVLVSALALSRCEAITGPYPLYGAYALERIGDEGAPLVYQEYFDGADHYVHTLGYDSIRFLSDSTLLRSTEYRLDARIDNRQVHNVGSESYFGSFVRRGDRIVVRWRTPPSGYTGFRSIDTLGIGPGRLVRTDAVLFDCTAPGCPEGREVPFLYRKR